MPDAASRPTARVPMPPPAKRRKRNVVDESDGDDNARPVTRASTLKDFFSSPPAKSPGSRKHTENRGPTTSPSPTRSSNRAALTSQSSNATLSSLPNRKRNNGDVFKSVTLSPEKLKGKPQKKKLEEKGKSADLVSLFSKQAQRAPTQHPRRNGLRSVNHVPSDDTISDPISEDEFAENKASASSAIGRIALKRSKDSSQTSSAGAPSASQNRFIRPPRPASAKPVDDDQRPWSERFAPINLEELCVNKKKVADVRRWLDDVMSGRMRQRLLILKGAAGTAKTTTVKLLSRDMGCELLEWRNPAGVLGGHLGFSSASAQFEDFMGRGGKFGQLDCDSDSSSNSKQHEPRPQDRSRKIILIEEFPNTFMRSSTALTSFRSTILQFLAANTPALTVFGRDSLKEPITPVVMIISETLLTTTSASADSFTTHRLLGPEILRHPGTGVIEFNTVAPTFLAKALELIVQKEARKSGRRRTPGPQVLKRLGEIGDIRSAISSLEFLCLRGDSDSDWGAKVAFTKGKRGSKEVALTRGEEESLEVISQREASLGIFHAVGKVVYNKRDDVRLEPHDPENQLPEFLAHHTRPKQSQVAVDTLIDETGTDTPTFISALHENYLLSCESTGPADPSSSLDYINGCAEYLSESDLLCPSWDIFFGGKGYSGAYFGKDSGSHVLRQDEMAFQVAVRGLLFALPHPVKRSTSSSKAGAAHQMFFPTSIKLWRTKEELEGLIDVWSAKLLKGDDVGLAPPGSGPHLVTSGAAAFRRVPAKGSAADRPAASQRATNHHAPPPPSSTPTAPVPYEGTEGAPAPLLAVGTSGRREMLLERLPYMAHIGRRRRGSYTPAGLREVEKVVSFSGIGAQAAEEQEHEAEPDEERVPGAETWATDRPTEEASPRKRRVAIRARSVASPGGLPALAEEKLVLSDDDIEDD